MKIKAYDYLVSYHYSKSDCLSVCYGTVQIWRPKKIKTFEDINELNKYITEHVDGALNVSVYNFILLGRSKH
jgi:hypothetical protein